MLLLVVCQCLFRIYIYIYIYNILPLLYYSFIVYLFNCSSGSYDTRGSSQRLDVKIKQHVPAKIIFPDLPMEILNNTFGSSIADHLLNNPKHAIKFSVGFLSILSKSHSLFHQKILETIYIRSR